jgi:hypothetical protein
LSGAASQPEQATSGAAPPGLALDNSEIATHGGIPLVRHNMNEMSPDELLHGGEHFDGVDQNLRRVLERQAARDSVDMPPREKLHGVVSSKQLRRPPPQSWRK